MGEFEDEYGPAAFVGRQAQVAAETARQLARDGETQPRAALSRRQGGIHPVKLVEDPGPVFRRHAGTAIEHGQDGAAAAPRPQGRRSPRRRRRHICRHSRPD